MTRDIEQREKLLQCQDLWATSIHYFGPPTTGHCCRLRRETKWARQFCSWRSLSPKRGKKYRNSHIQGQTETWHRKDTKHCGSSDEGEYSLYFDFCPFHYFWHYRNIIEPSDALFKLGELNALGKNCKIPRWKGYVSWGKKMEIGRNQILNLQNVTCAFTPPANPRARPSPSLCPLRRSIFTPPA